MEPCEDVCHAFEFLEDLPILTFTGARWFQWQGCTGIIAFIFAESKPSINAGAWHHHTEPSMIHYDLVVLQIRLYAMFSLDKRVLALMGSVFLAAIAASATTLGLVLVEIKSLCLNCTWWMHDLILLFSPIPFDPLVEFLHSG